MALSPQQKFGGVLRDKEAALGVVQSSAVRCHAAADHRRRFAQGVRERGGVDADLPPAQIFELGIGLGKGGLGFRRREPARILGDGLILVRCLGNSGPVAESAPDFGDFFADGGEFLTAHWDRSDRRNGGGWLCLGALQRNTPKRTSSWRSNLCLV